MSVQQGKGHPKGLYVLFATEIWERFNYYGMRAILIYFMTQALFFDKPFASNMYGGYTSLAYFTTLIGGYFADRYWGNRRSIILGGLVMALAEFVLFACGSIYQSSPDLAGILFYAGLGIMITGYGFFKPNISAMVGQLYPAGDKRIDAAYTIFYMGINLGAMVGPLVCGAVGNTGNPADFKWAFLAAGIGMLISVVTLKYLQDRYVVTPEGKPVGEWPEHASNSKFVLKKPFSIATFIALALSSVAALGLLYIHAKGKFDISWLLLAAVFVIGFIIFSDKSLTKLEKQKITVIFVVSFFVIFFWSAFEQAGASLSFFADEQTNRSVNLFISKTWAAVLGFGIATLLFYFMMRVRKATKNEQKGLREIFTVLFGAAIVYIVFATIHIANSPGSGISLQEIPPSWFQSVNSIFVVGLAPVFAWIWIKLGKRNLEPSSPAKMALGLLLLAVGYWVIAIGVKGQPQKASMFWLITLYAFHSFGELCLSPIGLSLVNKLAPLKFASLLMAVWFLANAAANVFAGKLSALYPEPGRTTVFLGYHIENLYDFFMFFVFMAGAAAFVLFILTGWLRKLMR